MGFHPSPAELKQISNQSQGAPFTAPPRQGAAIPLYHSFITDKKYYIQLVNQFLDTSTRKSKLHDITMLLIFLVFQWTVSKSGSSSTQWFFKMLTFLHRYCTGLSKMPHRNVNTLCQCISHHKNQFNSSIVLRSGYSSFTMPPRNFSSGCFERRLTHA